MTGVYQRLCGRLLGQDELAQAGGLQAVNSAVVGDGDAFVALQQVETVNGLCARGRLPLVGSASAVAAIEIAVVVWMTEGQGGGGQAGGHGKVRK